MPLHSYMRRHKPHRRCHLHDHGNCPQKPPLQVHTKSIADSRPEVVATSNQLASPVLQKKIQRVTSPRRAESSDLSTSTTSLPATGFQNPHKFQQKALSLSSASRQESQPDQCRAVISHILVTSGCSGFEKHLDTWKNPGSVFFFFF